MKEISYFMTPWNMNFCEMEQNYFTLKFDLSDTFYE